MHWGGWWIFGIRREFVRRTGMKLRLAMWGLVVCCGLHAETGRSAWLRYAALDAAVARQYTTVVPAVVTVTGTGVLGQSARDEVMRGVHGLLGKDLRDESKTPEAGAIVLGTLAEIHAALPQVALPATIDADGFWLKNATVGKARYLVVAGGDERGVLYGAFSLMRKISLGASLTGLDEKQTPYAPVRWVNEWDNLIGTIERGYGGASIFWEAGHARA